MFKNNQYQIGIFKSYNCVQIILLDKNTSNYITVCKLIKIYYYLNMFLKELDGSIPFRL